MQAVLARTVPLALLGKKLKGATWVEAEPILKGEKTYPPTGGMLNEECWRWRATLHGPKFSTRGRSPYATRWYRDDLHIAPDDDEPDVDLDVARQLFRPAPRALPHHGNLLWDGVRSSGQRRSGEDLP